MTLQNLLSRRHMPWIAAALGVGLCLPALGVGLVGDDIIQRQILLGHGGLTQDASPIWDLFVFVSGPDDLPRLMEIGIVPWWGHPELHLAFLRPLSSATHVLDYALWPDATWAQHLHSLLWYGLVVLLVGLLYRDVHGTSGSGATVAGLAVLLFAVEDNHYMPAAWLANRNALIALVIGLAALRAHLRWRRGGSWGWGAAAVGLIAVGLFAGEAALGALAYVAAWQLTRDHRAPWAARLGALVPYGAVVVAWRAVYRLADYEAVGSGLYIDPAGQPGAFALALAERWPLLQAAQWLQLRADVWSLLERPGQLMASGVGVVTCAGLLVLLWPLLRRSTDARFWALGSALALVPLCAAFPMDRLLLFAGLGAFGVLGLLARSVGLLGGDHDATTIEDHRRWARWTGGALVFIHGPLAALLLVGSIVTLPMFNWLFSAGARAAPADDAVTEQTLVFVHGNEFPVVYLKFIRAEDPDAPEPLRVATLSSMHSGSTLTVVDNHTITMTFDRPLLQMPFDRLMRTTDLPFSSGERIDTGVFVAEVLAVDDGGLPLAVRYTFADPLDDPDYRWLSWDDCDLGELQLPAAGESTRVEACPLLKAAWVAGRGGGIMGPDAP